MTEPWLLGRYEVVAELGKGAMGVVYRANDPMLNRMVAIKTINTEEAGHEGMAEYEARFYTEAKAAGGLNHPNIIIIYDIGKSGHLVYMAMEYIEGRELREMLADGKPIPVAQAVDIAAQVGEGLAYAHQHQVVHRDIKPANIMITPEGRAKIADFGIARMRSSETRTQTGVILGSPKYISPEQVVGKRADHRSDIFSLGVILYECITGATPFNGEGLSALMYQITNHDPVPPSSSNSQVPVMLDYIVAKVLAKAPEARYQSSADFANDLRECKAQILTGQPGVGPGMVTTKPPIPAALLAAAKPAPAAPSAQDTGQDTTTIPSPTKGISRAFDSQEATQRLMKQIAADGTTEFVSTRNISATSISRDRALRPGGERPWGHRENVIFATTVAVAVVIATAIVLV
ncbi:MAG TPA: serine/threonine-protein kinase [Burkholderiales bacterium]|nr:serine/threonine-protein kinase [Burkholderiales bacterium]